MAASARKAAGRAASVRPLWGWFMMPSWREASLEGSRGIDDHFAPLVTRQGAVRAQGDRVAHEADRPVRVQEQEAARVPALEPVVAAPLRGVGARRVDRR